MSLIRQIKFLAQNVVYQDYPELIGKRISIDIQDSHLKETLIDKIQELSDKKIYELVNDNIKGLIDKYGFLDLNFSLADFSYEQNENPIDILKKQGIFQRHSDLDDEEREKERDVLSIILEPEIEKLKENKCYLKIFASASDDPRDWKKIRYRKNLFGKYKKRNLRNVHFTIADACITNMKGIWMNKHFYL